MWASYLDMSKPVTADSRPINIWRGTIYCMFFDTADTEAGNRRVIARWTRVEVCMGMGMGKDSMGMGKVDFSTFPFQMFLL